MFLLLRLALYCFIFAGVQYFVALNRINIQYSTSSETRIVLLPIGQWASNEEQQIVQHIRESRVDIPVARHNLFPNARPKIDAIAQNWQENRRFGDTLKIGCRMSTRWGVESSHN
jgi:hypothetical protein